MKKITGYIVLLISSVLLLSCGGGSSSEEILESVSCQEAIAKDGCSIPVQNKCVHEVMKNYYLWYQQVEPVIDYEAFNSPSETLDYLRFDERDRFSVIMSDSYYQSVYSDGEYYGYGFAFETDTAGRVWVRYVYHNAPTDLAGIQRGDEIVSVNNQTLTDVTSNPDWNDFIFGPNEDGYPVDMVIRKSDGSTSSIHMRKALVDINTVLHSSVIDGGAVKTGYLVFNRFMDKSTNELATVFADFKAAGVNRLILDLRYNGGGLLRVANTLASYLKKVSTTNSVFGRLTYNDKNQQNNYSYMLEQLNNSLNLDQLIVITTASTCSASEMIINGLSPYIPVKTVGSTTCGKPIGMNPFSFCSNVMLPITFELQNSNGVGGYFDGIAADCPAEDNVKIGFGDAADPMLAQARYLAENGSCKPVAARDATAPTISRHRSSTDLRDIIGAY
jgi:carboxyl-terminal processing protease